MTLFGGFDLRLPAIRRIRKYGSAAVLSVVCPGTVVVRELRWHKYSTRPWAPLGIHSMADPVPPRSVQSSRSRRAAKRHAKDGCRHQLPMLTRVSPRSTPPTPWRQVHGSGMHLNFLTIRTVSSNTAGGTSRASVAPPLGKGCRCRKGIAVTERCAVDARPRP